MDPPAIRFADARDPSNGLFESRLTPGSIIDIEPFANLTEAAKFSRRREQFSCAKRQHSQGSSVESPRHQMGVGCHIKETSMKQLIAAMVAATFAALAFGTLAAEQAAPAGKPADKQAMEKKHHNKKHHDKHHDEAKEGSAGTDKK